MAAVAASSACSLRFMGFLLLTISAMICLLAAVLFLLSPTQSQSLSLHSQQTSPYLQTDHQGWWGGGHDDCHHGNDKWNILYHLGGNGPWIEKVDGVAKGGIAVPDGCEVDMVHMMSRHAERYPTKSSGARMERLLERLAATGKPLTGSLGFVNTWEYFTDSPDRLEQLTTTGPYAGILEAFTTGVKLGTRYRHLWNESAEDITYLWASDSGRVIDTARHFSAGFFGLGSPAAEVVVISEAEDKGGDTLTPGDTCKNNNDDKEKGHDNGATQSERFRSTYLPAISERLERENPGFNFTNDEIYSMQEMCGFETIVRGASPWCGVFTHKEWQNFEYARDVTHYYRSGQGNIYAKAMGWLWLNATTNLLLEGPQAAGPLYFSFVHDGDVVPMLAALGLFEDVQDLPVDSVWEDRRWKTSQITPMGGRIILERLTCGTERYVRFNVNDGIVSLDGCGDGPGESCELQRFAEYVKRRGEEAGDFRSVCGLDESAPDRLTFLRQPGFPGPKV